MATALRLRALGYEVTLLERLQSLGGRAQVFEQGGYRHDAGPTVITAPFLFDELFELFDAANFLDIRPLFRLLIVKLASEIKNKTPQEIINNFDLPEDVFTDEEKAAFERNYAFTQTLETEES